MRRGIRAVGEKLWDKRRLVLVVVSAIAILVVGSWLRPRHRPIEIVVSEAERVRLQMLAQKGSLQGMASYFGQLAQQWGPQYLVRVKETEASGVVWDAAGSILTPAPARSYPTEFRLLWAGRERIGAVVTATPGVPLYLVQGELSGGLRPVEVNPVGRPLPGAWVLLVARAEGGEATHAPGVYSAVVPCQCEDYSLEELVTTIPANRAMQGGGVFDLEGRLMGVVVPCEERFVTVSVAAVQSLLRQAEQPEQRLLSRYGMRVTALDPAAARYFRTTEGALVSEVWEGSPAAEAALAPGDILTRWNEEQVGEQEDWGRLGEDSSGAGPQVEVRRGRRTVRLRMEPAPSGWWARPGRAAASGILFEVPAPGFAIESVEAGSRAHAGGLRAGDRLLTVDGRRVSRRQDVEALLAGAGEKPAYVVVRRGQRRMGVLLP